MTNLVWLELELSDNSIANGHRTYVKLCELIYEMKIQLVIKL